MKIKRFNENSPWDGNEPDSLENSYTVGDLKKFINRLPDDMSVITFSNDKDSPVGHFIKVVNGSKVGMSHPTTGEQNDYLVISID